MKILILNYFVDGLSIFRRKISNLAIALLLLVIVSVFFYPVFFAKIPFPGDLLVGNYSPYNTIDIGGYLPGSVPHKAQGPDVIRQLFPWKHFVIDALKSQSLPFWNPHNFSGNPMLANFQSGVFYPFNILFLLLPFNSAWTVYIYSIPFLSAFFLYLYLRELDLEQVPSLFAGIVYAFSGYMTVWSQYGNIGHTLAWLPLAFYFSEKIIKRFSAERLIYLIFTLVIMLTGGYIQGYFYAVLALAFYYILKVHRKIISVKNIVFCLSLVYPVFLTLFQLMPTIGLFRLSSRSNYTQETISLLLNPLWYAITMVVPDYFGHPATRNHWFYGTYIERVSYIGLIPLIFAVFAVIYYRKQKEIFIMFALSIITFVLAFDFYLTRFFYLLPIPVISTTVPTRILSLFAFCGSVLSGYGLHFFLRDKKVKKLVKVLMLIGLILICGWVYTLISPIFNSGLDWHNQMLVSRRNLLFPTFIFLAMLIGIGLIFISKKSFKIVVFVLIFVTLFDLFRFFHKITPFSPEVFIYPKTPVLSFIGKNAGLNRYWGYGSGYIDTNFQTYDKTYFPDGNDPLHLKRYTEFIESSKTGKVPAVLPRPDANLAPGYGSEDLRSNYYRQKAMNLLGIKYVLHKLDGLGSKMVPDYATFDEKLYKLVWQNPPWQIYENKAVFPRVFLAADYLVLDKDEIIPVFYSKEFSPLKTLIVEKEPGIQKAKNVHGKATLEKYLPNEIIIKTSADKDTLLFLSDTYYPEWRVNVDSEESEVLIADYAFRAVKVPRGEHSVRFYYDPVSFKAGLKLSSLALAVLVLFYLLAKRTQLYEKNSK